MQTELVGLFSCFTGIHIPDDLKSQRPQDVGYNLQSVIELAENITNNYIDFENEERIDTGTDYSIVFDVAPYIMKWCNSSNIAECREVLNTIEENKGIFIGEFVKAIIKINNIASEIERVAESVGNITLVGYMKDVPKLTLKYIATNQSLYI